MVTTHGHFKLAPSLCMSIIMSDVLYEMHHTHRGVILGVQEALTLSQMQPTTQTTAQTEVHTQRR